MAGMFDNLATDFQAGDTAAQQVTDNWRKNKAMNALNRIYGDVSGDPDDAIKMQSYGYNQQMDPLKVQEQQQSNDFNSQIDPLKVQGANLTNAGQQLTNDSAQQTLQTEQMSNASAQALKTHGVLSASLDNLGAQLKGVTDPTKRGVLFDQELAHIAPLIGVDPRIAASNLADERARIVANGAAAIPDIQNDLDGVIMGSLAPADKLKLQQTVASGAQKQQLTQAQIDKTNAETDAVKAKAQAATAKAAGSTPDQQAAAGVFLTGLDGGDEQVAAAGKFIDSMSDVPLIAKGMEAVPGTNEYKFKQAAESISNMLSDLGIKSLRTLGTSLGRATNTEFTAEAKAFANLDIGQGKTVLKAQLAKAQALITKARSLFQQAPAGQAAGAAAAVAPAAAASAGGGGAAAPQTYTYNPATGELE